MLKAQFESIQEDIQMSEGKVDSETLLKIAEPEPNTFLIKMPQWIADTISNSAVGTEIGYSQDLMDYISKGGDEVPKEELRLVLSAKRPGKGGPAQASEYAISFPSSSQNLRVLETTGTTTLVTRVLSTMHVIPRRDALYATVLRDRINASDVSKQHRTIHNEEDFSTSRTAVKLFQRPESVPETPSPDSADLSRASKRIRSLDEMPQRESRQTLLSSPTSSSKSLDEVLMETLVHRDEGWPLQQLSKALKEKGVSAPMAQLKAKLLEICVYQRRGEDSHPRYYLKSEYK